MRRFPGDASDERSSIGWYGNTTWARLLIRRFDSTSTPSERSVSISLSSASGFITTPFPTTPVLPGRRMPLGISESL